MLMFMPVLMWKGEIKQNLNYFFKRAIAVQLVKLKTNWLCDANEDEPKYRLHTTIKLQVKALKSADEDASKKFVENENLAQNMPATFAFKTWNTCITSVKCR